jgi:hypothetical protein
MAYDSDELVLVKRGYLEGLKRKAAEADRLEKQRERLVREAEEARRREEEEDPWGLDKIRERIRRRPPHTLSVAATMHALQPEDGRTDAL